jgi:hypothetical protein
MKIPIGLFLAIMFPAFFAIGARLVYVNDKIIHYVFRRDGQKYPILWWMSPRHFDWQLRAFSFGWYREVREAGYFKEWLILTIMGVGIVVVFAAASLGGFLNEHVPVKLD